METNEEYLSTTGFTVRISGMNWNTFESVSGIGVDIEDIAFQSDKNQLTNRPGRFNARDIRLTRRFKKDRELYDWMKAIKDGKQERKSGSVVLTDDEGNKVLSLDFDRAWPKSWSGPKLSKDQGGNDILKEEIVLSVGDLTFA